MLEKINRSNENALTALSLELSGRMFLYTMTYSVLFASLCEMKQSE